jgi:hypothetical protein
MSADSGPSIPKTGLAFSYDMRNTQQSFKGVPTVNLTPDMGIVAIQAVTVTYVGVEDGWKKYSLNGTWTSGTYPYSMATDAITFTGGVTYSTSMYIKTNVPAKFASLFGGMNYVNQPMNNTGTSVSSLQPDGSFYVARIGFQYTSTTSQNGYLLSQPVVSQVFSSATDFVYIKSGQIEANAFPTPFVAGTRSTTAALLDQTGNNTMTTVSLTYTDSNTPSFNGSTNHITVGNTGMTHGTADWTYTMWANWTAITSLGTIYENGSWTSSLLIRFETNGFTIYSMGSLWGFVSFTPVLNTWYHLTFVRTGNTVLFYVNSIQTGTVASFTANIVPGTSLTFIGMSQHAPGQCFNGRLDAGSIYTRALSLTEVQQNFNASRIRYNI